MDLKLAGKSALITGASQGIGLAVARQMAEEGCHVHLAARSQDKLEAAAAAIGGEFAVEAHVHVTDLTHLENIQALARDCAGVDILVNNAGAVPGGRIDELDDTRWRAGWELKVFGYINMTRAFYHRMRERGDGVIVNVIGLGGERPYAGYVTGSAGNASLMAFTRAVGGSSLDHGVRILAVNPGLVDTERARTLLQTRAETQYGDKERWRDYYKHLPLQRAATAEEVGDLVVYLASRRASYISGTVVTIDGGASVRQG